MNIKSIFKIIILGIFYTFVSFGCGQGGRGAELVAL